MCLKMEVCFPLVWKSIRIKRELTVEAEPRKVGLNRQGEGELKKGELQVLFPAER